MKANQRIIFNRAGAVQALDKTWHQIEVTGNHATLYNGERIVQVVDRTALEMMVDAFQGLANGESFAGVLVDRDHLSHDPTQSTEAMGWLKNVEIRGGQLWGEIEWTDVGAEAVRNRRFKFFSTEYPAAGLVDLGEGRVRPTILGGLALTNRPNNKGGEPISNRDGQAAGSSERQNQNDKNDTTMKNIAKQIGLPDDATEDQITNRLAAILKENGDLKNKAAEAEAEAVLNRFGSRIPETAKAGWRTQLIANREGAEQLLIASFPEPAAGDASKAGAAEAGRKPLTNRATAEQPDASRATGAVTDGLDEVAIRNRAHAINKEQGCGFDKAWSRARQEAEEAAGKRG